MVVNCSKNQSSFNSSLHGLRYIFYPYTEWYDDNTNTKEGKIFFSECAESERSNDD